MTARGGAMAVDTDLLQMPAPLTAAYVVPAGARLVVVSGLTAKDGASRTVAANDAAGQADHILDAIDDLLHTVGGDLNDVIKLTVYLQNRADAPAVGRVRARRFTTPPASTMIVAELMSPDQLVEIEAIAALES